MYFKQVSINIKSSMQYRLATLFLFISQVLISLSEVVLINILFARFHSVGGYSVFAIYVTFGMIMIIFSLCEGIFRGIDQFSTLIRMGDLDRFLIRPKSILMQVIAEKQEFTKFGRTIVGIVFFVIGIVKLGVDWTALKIVCLCLSFVCGFVIMFAINLMTAGISVFTIQGMEMTNILTDGGRDVCMYPIDIYGKNFFAKFFTFIIPFACFNFLPLRYILSMSGANFWGNFMAPVYGMFFIVPCFLFFRWSLSKYQGTGT